MKITIQKRELDKNGHRALRLVYYHGSKTGQNGSRAQKRSYEPLNLFLYDKPRLPAEREHNKTVNQKAEAIRAKRLLGGHHGLRRRCREGVLAGRILLNYVVWGNGSVSARLWNAICSDDWAIPHVGLSSLGEIVGWARPDEFPPRNMRTSKGLRALGYSVRIGV
jgi:hypothetical protein